MTMNRNPFQNRAEFETMHRWWALDAVRKKSSEYNALRTSRDVDFKEHDEVQRLFNLPEEKGWMSMILFLGAAGDVIGRW